MRTQVVVVLSLAVVVLLSETAHAQDGMFTQIGTWTCTVLTQKAPNPLRCPAVNFPKPFGGVPSVVTTACLDMQYNVRGSVCIGSGAQGVTPQGFVPVINPYQIASNPMPSQTLSGTWIAVGPVVPLRVSGTVVPKYLVLSVVYAPPGTNGGHRTNSVSYQAGSKTGMTISASQSFKYANSLTSEVSDGIVGTDGGAGISFESSRSSTDSQSLDIKKSATATITQAGPSQDGLNHDEDEIWLLLNPTVILNLTCSSAQWMMANTNANVQHVRVGWLNGHQTMPTEVANELEAAGITAQEYPDILASDPLADGLASFDPKRYVLLNTTLSYEPPDAQGDTVPTITFNISNSSVTTIGSTYENTYKVGLTSSYPVGPFLDFVKANFKDVQSWEWTTKSSPVNSMNRESALVTIGGPAYGYTGPTIMDMYFDVEYKTFAFALVTSASQELAVDGTLVTASGKAIPWTELTLVENGIVHRTFTNAKGQFRFFGHIVTPAEVHALGFAQLLPAVESGVIHIAFKMPAAMVGR